MPRVTGGSTLSAEVEIGSELPALVVAPEHENCVGEGDFEGQDNCHHLNRKMTTIDIVA